MSGRQSNSPRSSSRDVERELTELFERRARTLNVDAPDLDDLDRLAWRGGAHLLGLDGGLDAGLDAELDGGLDAGLDGDEVAAVPFGRRRSRAPIVLAAAACAVITLAAGAVVLSRLADRSTTATLALPGAAEPVESGAGGESAGEGGDSGATLTTIGAAGTATSPTSSTTRVVGSSSPAKTGVSPTSTVGGAPESKTDVSKTQVSRTQVSKTQVSDTRVSSTGFTTTALAETTTTIEYLTSGTRVPSSGNGGTTNPSMSFGVLDAGGAYVGGITVIIDGYRWQTIPGGPTVVYDGIDACAEFKFLASTGFVFDESGANSYTIETCSRSLEVTMRRG